MAAGSSPTFRRSRARHRDRNGATAVSLTTWIMFTAANVATVSYALVISRDAIVAAIFALNAFGCLVIAVMTALRRLAWARTQQRGGSERGLPGRFGRLLNRQAPATGRKALLGVLSAPRAARRSMTLR